MLWLFKMNGIKKSLCNSHECTNEKHIRAFVAKKKRYKSAKTQNGVLSFVTKKSTNQQKQKPENI